jgi:predicted lactoylglutathione lyase
MIVFLKVNLGENEIRAMLLKNSKYQTLNPKQIQMTKNKKLF